MADLKDKSTQEFRLPGDIIPLHYDLSIVTHLKDKFDFNGDVNIKIKCLKATNTIKIHSRDLEIPKNEVTIKPVEDEKKGKNVYVVDTSIDIENEFFIINTKESLAAENEYILHIPFQGQLKENLIGYYRSQYFDSISGTNKWLAVTHFEPSDARQAFPCFDEPGMKATFSIRLSHDNSFSAISNMPLKEIQDHSPPEGENGHVWSVFDKSVPMSTYLVAFMVSQLGHKVSDPEPNHVIFRVWARKDALYQAEFPAKVGPHFLNFYEDFFGIEYPLPKQELLAIPDFKISGMENWGLITFRESSLLLDEKTVSSTNRLQIASVIAHELAHMWFGNLVTMWWWTDLWLKEGFATYMAGIAVHHEFPEWNSLDAEALSDLLRVFHLDSLKSSHPVSVPIGHSKEISQIFDAISYYKGSFLLRMMSLFLGDTVFRHGVSEYLKKHKFGNAEQDDLWASLTEQAHRYSVLPPELTVKQIMDTWTLQTGYPLVTVTRVYGDDTSKTTISQTRYLATKSNNESDYKDSWWVPLSYSTEKDPRFNHTQPDHWLPQNQKVKEVSITASPKEWIIFNNRAAGLYKVNYDSKNWQLLIDALNSEKFEDINVMNRALLICDSMDLANSGFVDYDLAFSLINYVKRETAFVPWNAVLSKLEPIKTKLNRTPLSGAFKRFIRSLLEPIVENLGPMDKDPKSFEDGRLMNLISQWAAPIGIKVVDTQAQVLFGDWKKSADPDKFNPIPKDVRRAVYAHAVMIGGEEAWDFLWERYKNANVVAEKNNILMALTNAVEPWLIDRYLEWTLREDSGIRKQDAFLIFSVTASKDMGFYVAHKFFLRKISRISEYFGANSNLIGHYFSAVTHQIIYQGEYDELKAFSEKHKGLLAPASLTVKQALESVELNIGWVEKHYSSISAILRLLSES